MGGSRVAWCVVQRACRRDVHFSLLLSQLGAQLTRTFHCLDCFYHQPAYHELILKFSIPLHMLQYSVHIFLLFLTYSGTPSSSLLTLWPRR